MDLQAVLEQSPTMAVLIIAAAAGGWLERIRKDGLSLNVRIHPDDIRELGKAIAAQLVNMPTTSKEPTCEP